ncbi:alkene reductase [Mucilaginibacter agri]|uniref:Alkene reductase n=1 Tax=Mucilaginibacter agri TaxID=2695265 RepID=A0A966DTX4_9SPHI|nr:alkene reductase [Mucilaginibacter agri]NCD71110.1 alkene reductase [Mucilaginibacter agri]
MENSIKNTDLFTPVTIGGFQMKNRIMMAPLTRSRAGNDGVPTDLHAQYYAQRASAGLIISEATNISPMGKGYAFTPGIWSKEQVNGWKKVTDAVHQAGGLIVCQFWHVGRFSHTSVLPGGISPVSSSAVKADGKTYTEHGFEDVSMPRALETNEIPALLEDYRHATACAKAAGFDGVEIHSANNYLLEQFIRDSVNHRTDKYGGGVENRTRLTCEVVEVVVKEWGDSNHVGIRLSPTTPDAGNTSMDSDVMGTYGFLIEKLNAYNLAYLHFVEGATANSREIPEGIDLQVLRKKFNGPYVANNGYTLALANDARRSDLADAIAFGRPWISNPDLVYRLENGIPLTHAPREAFYGGGAVGYTDWPTAN